MSASAVWHVCGTDDPCQDKIVVWVMYEEFDVFGRFTGIVTGLASFGKGVYRLIRTNAAADTVSRRGKAICWSYVIDKPKGPTLVFDGKRWTIGSVNADYFKDH